MRLEELAELVPQEEDLTVVTEKSLKPLEVWESPYSALLKE